MRKEQKMKNLHHTPTAMKALLIAVSIPFFLVGCNTIEGAGTDIKYTGQAIENAAEEVKNPCPPTAPCPPTRSRISR
jgi:predicted small secreted protein